GAFKSLPFIPHCGAYLATVVDLGCAADHILYPVRRRPVFVVCRAGVMADHRPTPKISVIDADDELEVAATDRGKVSGRTSLPVERDGGVLQNAAVGERSVRQSYFHDVPDGRARTTTHPPDVCTAGRVDGL